MPNIKGTDASGWGGDRGMSGAFYKAEAMGNDANTGSNKNTIWRRYFDASRSSSTYQDNAKVNPDHIYVNFVIKY